MKDPAVRSPSGEPGEIWVITDVSLSTVKSHITSIFRKFGVSAREDAVGRARKMGLL